MPETRRAPARISDCGEPGLSTMMTLPCAGRETVAMFLTGLAFEGARQRVERHDAAVVEEGERTGAYRFNNLFPRSALKICDLGFHLI